MKYFGIFFVLASIGLNVSAAFFSNIWLVVGGLVCAIIGIILCARARRKQKSGLTRLFLILGILSLIGSVVAIVIMGFFLGVLVAIIKALGGAGGSGS